MTLEEQLNDAIKNIGGTYTEAVIDIDESVEDTLPADPNVKNYSYTIVGNDVYYRKNSVMIKPDLNTTAKQRVKGLVELRDCVNELIEKQMDADVPDSEIKRVQGKLNTLYDKYVAKYGIINSRANSLAFADDSSYYLLCSLENVDEDRQHATKADMFTKRTIKPHKAVTSVDTASEALALSIGEKARVDMEYMSKLTGKTEQELYSELKGVIFLNPLYGNNSEKKYLPADEYLSGNVRNKLEVARFYAAQKPEEFAINVEALTTAQPKDLDASEIEVRLGATWIDVQYIKEFMWETFDMSYQLRRNVELTYSQYTAEWNIKGKNSASYNDVNVYMTYGTQRANAFRILEDSLNLRDVRVYDTVQDADGEVEQGLEELKSNHAERFTIKSLERTKRNLEARLKKLQNNDRKDDVVTFEQLGVDRLFVDEAHAFKNLFLYTKMRNAAGLSTSDAQKSSDMYLKCRYIDEITGSKCTVFATGTPTHTL